MDETQPYSTYSDSSTPKNRIGFIRSDTAYYSPHHLAAIPNAAGRAPAPGKRPRFFKRIFPFLGEFFSGPVVGAFPQARVSKMMVVSPCETPRSDIGLLQNERFVQDFRHKQQGTSPGILSCQTSAFLFLLRTPSFRPVSPKWTVQTWTNCVLLWTPSLKGLCLQSNFT